MNLWRSSSKASPADVEASSSSPPLTARCRFSKLLCMAASCHVLGPSAFRGQAAGVPFVALPPIREERSSAPVVVSWHLMDAPRTETAFAAAVPLSGLDAWRIYLGLPLCGSRLPTGGWEEVMRLGYEDAVLKLIVPVVDQATGEVGRAIAGLRS